MANLGFIGLGMMGARVARRLMAAGNTLTGYNRTKSKANELIAAGMKWANTPREVVESTDIAFSMVTDTNALRSIAEGDDGVLAALSPGKIYVEMSEVSPIISKALAADVKARGARMIDAPVSGSPGTLDAGQAFIMAAGDPNAFSKVEPLLLQIGASAAYMGPSGNAVLMKVAINLNLAVQMLGLFEGLLVAEKGGIPRNVALDALLNSVAGSPHMRYRALFIETPPSEVWFSTDLMRKNLLLALEAGHEFGVQMPSTELASQIAHDASVMGFASEDFVSMFKVLAKRAGVMG
jgi:3-hydroxyisobutyrate dehydrogenase-like beta-hydroxyacid dehydrogenase